MPQPTPAEIYWKDHINTMRSFLLRKGDQKLEEWPTKDLPPHVEDMLDCVLEEEYANAFHHQRILGAYLVILSDINRYGMHEALVNMVDEFFRQAQDVHKRPIDIVMSDEITRVFLSNCQFMRDHNEGIS